MVASTFFSPKMVGSYTAKLSALSSGAVIRPDHVDIHVQNRCNARCRDCIGRSGAGSVERRINNDNIGGVIDNIIAGYDDIPDIHFAGFTGDPFFGIRGCDVTGDPSNPAVEGFLHLLRKGLDHAKKATFITNGIGLARNNINPLCEREYSFVELLQFAGSVQISLDASSAEQYRGYKQVDMFGHVMDNIRNLAFWSKHANELDRHGLFDGLGIPDELGTSSPPMTLVVNYVLHHGNSEIKEGFIEALEMMDVDELRFRTDYFLRDDADFQSRMHESVKALREKYSGINMSIIMKSPEHPISQGSFAHCVSPFFWPAVGIDGNVYPCAHTVSPGFAIGSLFEKSLLEIIGDYYNRFASGDTAEKMCRLFCPSTAGRINMLQAEAGF